MIRSQYPIITKSIIQRVYTSCIHVYMYIITIVTRTRTKILYGPNKILNNSYNNMHKQCRRPMRVKTTKNIIFSTKYYREWRIVCT